MFTIIEPLRGQDLMSRLNHLASSNQHIFALMSFLSDFIVLLFPIVLIALYVHWWRKKNQKLQINSLIIVLWVIISVWADIIIQQIFNKARPETLPWLKLILSHLPTMSFPSDHASVGMWFAVAFLLSFKNSWDKKIIWLWYFLLLWSLIMWICRTAVAVHRPTDIIVWRIIWLIWGRLARKLYQTTLAKKVFNWVISLGNKILDQIISICISKN